MEREAHQLYTCSPRHSFPPGLFHRFQELGLGVQAHSHEGQSRAARLRVAHNFSLFLSLRDKLCEVLESDEFLLTYRYAMQYRRSLFVQLMEDYEASIYISRLPDPC
eukprot:1263207-Pyramimonas_sp.AAC.1